MNEEGKTAALQHKIKTIKVTFFNPAFTLPFTSNRAWSAATKG